MSTTHTSETITQAVANNIARAALNGDSRYTMEAIGEEDGDINSMETEAGGKRIIRASNDTEVAVYELTDGALLIVADANGPVAIRIR